MEKLRVIDTFEQAALAAGRTILEVFEQGIHVTLKTDCSPVTEADERADRLLSEDLVALPPDDLQVGVADLEQS